jgi:uncharacterized membrane protein
VTPTRLDLSLEAAFTAGLAVGGLLLVAGLTLGSPRSLTAGLLVLMVTPVVGALIVAVGMVLRRDWTFVLVSAAILLVLGSSLYTAARIAAAR